MLKLYIEDTGYEIPITYSKFPAGETHIQISKQSCLSDKANLVIIMDFRDNTDIIDLCLLIDAIKREYRGNYIKLAIPYLHYGRQDRVCNAGEAFSLKVISKIISQLEYNELIVFDTHSTVAEALFDSRLKVIEQSSIIGVPSSRYNVILCPDAGAVKKLKNYSNNIVFASKVRINGNVETFIDDKSLEFLENKNIYVIDDICDGGRTFLGIGSCVRESGINFNSLNLMVTHGIFSNSAKAKLSNYYTSITAKFDWTKGHTTFKDIKDYL